MKRMAWFVLFYFSSIKITLLSGTGRYLPFVIEGRKGNGNGIHDD